MARLSIALVVAASIVGWSAGAAAFGADNTGLNADILRLARDWEHIKFQVQDKDAQEQQIADLARRAADIVAHYQNRPEAQIWLGIIVSEQASMANENGSPFKALGFAKEARDVLEKAEKEDPSALDAGAPTSLGVLYYRVPGFPLGFGDTAKARQLLQEAVARAPNGLDANYFYGDFLYQQHEYAAAEQVLKRALTLPAHPERPIWDRSRRLVMQELLAKMSKTQ